jgi:hypothetical protein
MISQLRSPAAMPVYLYITTLEELQEETYD